MPVSVRTDAQGCTLSVVGELNIYQAAELMPQIRASLPNDQPLFLELSQVDEIDAAGLQMLVAIRTHALAHGLSCVVTSQSDAVMALLELADMAGLFGVTMVLSEEAA